MDTQDSSVWEPLADMYSEDTTTNEASQDSSGPFEVMPTPLVNEKYRPLFEAAQKGDWKSAKKILEKDDGAMRAEILFVEAASFTALDVAIMASQDQFVKRLIKSFHPDKYFDFSTSLETAAIRGRIKIVKALVNKVDAESVSVCRALRIATTWTPKQKEVVWYLAKRAKFAPINGTMFMLTRAGHLDIALYLAHRYPGSTSDEERNHILGHLAKMESNFRSGARLNFWEKSIGKFIGIPLCLVDIPFDNSMNMPQVVAKWFKISLSSYATTPALLIKRIGLRHKCSLQFAKLVLTEMKTRMETPEILKLLSKIVLNAASHGIPEIVKLCFEHFPELTWNPNLTEEVMKNVVNKRHVELFRLVNAPSTLPLLIDDTRKDLMKAVVEWSPTCLPKDVSGAPFLMQRELQWFKVLEDTSDPSSKSLKLKKVLSDKIDPASKSYRLPEDKKPYWDDFVEKRKELLKEAGQWMKDTSSSCSLVSTLIITVAFVAAFTVPGGNDDSRGMPIFLQKGSFMVFVVADSLALFSSVTATLMFLAILTSRYGAEDFLNSLPTKMILGLTFLFLSLAFMLVAFGSALTIILSEQLKWIYIPITLLAAIPAVLFAILHLPLYFEMVESTYWPRLYRPLKLWE